MPGRPPDYTRHKLRAAAGFVLVSFLVLEIAVRLMCRYDADGNRWFRNLQLKPYRLPVREMTEFVRKYDSSQTRILAYSPDLGWVPQPLRKGYNAHSFYSTAPAVDRTPSPDRLRVALFGASYTAGSFETGWWRSLEKSLNDSGVPAEVFNFGCGGYAMDQSFLRWRNEGAAYHPHVVIFGFTDANSGADLNLFRWFTQSDTGIPFMKPRFVLDHDKLRLINTPTPELDEVPGIVAHFPDWPLARYEHYFVPADYQMLPWRHSALLALFEARFATTDQPVTTGSSGEAEQLAVKIIRQFKSETEAAGSTFYVVHLPIEPDLRAIQDTGTYPSASLLTAIKGMATVIQPESALLAAAGEHNLSRYFFDGHYTTEFNPVVGQAVAKALLACPEVERFRKTAAPAQPPRSTPLPTNAAPLNQRMDLEQFKMKCSR
jgi:hypothetical protein